MKIAIIGSGISGLGAAYLLHNSGHEVTIYEKNDYIGGHSRTVEVEMDGKNIPVDTGFIVFNDRNYPNLTGLFKHLDVAIEKSNMSFGVSIEDGWLEYGAATVTSIFAQKINLIRPCFWRMIFDILKFNYLSHRYIDSGLNLGEFLDKINVKEWFRNYYLLAMGGAIWSTPRMGMLDFPAKSFIRFFDNHGLNTISDHPQWFTVKGGSREYVKKLTAQFRDKIFTDRAVTKVMRSNDNVIIVDNKNNISKFDKVIFACHSDQAIKLLDNPTEDEKKLIGAIKYQKNTAILHSDESFMPKRKECWASWVYLSDTKFDNNPSVSLTYWMNLLQDIKSSKPLLVTLNPSRRPENVYDEYVFEHPVFDEPAINAQENMEKIQGKNNTWYCGAYMKYGFHEDGFRSGVEVAKKLGATIPWN